jgi:hypothetical protein
MQANQKIASNLVKSTLTGLSHFTVESPIPLVDITSLTSKFINPFFLIINQNVGIRLVWRSGLQRRWL